MVAAIGDKVGKDWALARRVQAGETWHPATDCLAGTDTYGRVPPQAEQAGATFSIQYSEREFTHFLFTSGYVHREVNYKRSCSLISSGQSTP